jgi:glucose/arabinose dehydrogenase
MEDRMRYGRLLTLLAALTACGGSGSQNTSTDPGNSGGMPDGGMGDGSGSGSDGGMGDGSGSGSGSDANPDDPVAGCTPTNGGIALPDGFCATVFADHAGKVRHIAVTPSGHVFVAVQPSAPGAGDAHVLSLFDADDDGVAEQQSTFGAIGGNGIDWRDGKLYVAANDRIVRYELPDGASAPGDGEPVVLVSGLPDDADHPAKTVVVVGDRLYINIGSPSNTCQVDNRALHSPGKDACEELDTRAGIWKFSADKADQTPDCGERIGTGLRNTNAMAFDWDAGQLWGAINGRDQLHENWPELFTEEQDKLLPSEEVVAIKDGIDRGWPYCYHDVVAGEMKLAPEYGGDGTAQGRCAAIDSPDAVMPAHAAPLGMVFATGEQFPPPYRNGMFVANHGSRFDANATGQLHGYDVEFIPFKYGYVNGDPAKFAAGFDAGLRPLPAAAPHRPVGLAMMPDGSLLIGDDKGGRIWRVFYRPE